MYWVQTLLNSVLDQKVYRSCLIGVSDHKKIFNFILSSMTKKDLFINQINDVIYEMLCFRPEDENKDLTIEKFRELVTMHDNVLLINNINKMSCKPGIRVVIYYQKNDENTITLII